MNAELERKKAIVSELLNDCDHTDGDGNSLAEEMTTLIDEISMCVGVCKICGAWLGLETNKLASVGKGCDSFEIVREWQNGCTKA